MVNRTGQDRLGQDRTGQDSTGQDRTGQDKLTFKLNFPGNLWLAALAILAMFHLVSVSKNERVHELARRFCLYLPIVAHSVDLGHAELQNLNKGKALRSNSALLRLLKFFFLSWSSFFIVRLRGSICKPGWGFFYPLRLFAWLKFVTWLRLQTVTEGK